MTNPTTLRGIEALLDSVAPGAFPACIVDLSVSRFQMLDLDINVVPRMPSLDDENYTLGIVSVNKNPQASSNEIGKAFRGATILEYLIVYYAFVKDGDRERGAANHSAFAEIVECIVATDAAFRQGLGQLSSTIMGQTKRYQGSYIRTTRYLANEIGGNHNFMSATEVIYEVEKV